MKTLIACAFLAISTSAAKSSFIEDAIYFLTGAEFSNFPAQETKVNVRYVPDGGSGWATSTFSTMPDEPCVVIQAEQLYYFASSKTWEISTTRSHTWDFNLFPSPKYAWRTNEGYTVLELHKKNAHCMAEKGQGGESASCVVENGFTPNFIARIIMRPNLSFQRLSRLNYIRANYCPGLPESVSSPPRF